VKYKFLCYQFHRVSQTSAANLNHDRWQTVMDQTKWFSTTTLLSCMISSCHTALQTKTRRPKIAPMEISITSNVWLLSCLIGVCRLAASLVVVCNAAGRRAHGGLPPPGRPPGVWAVERPILHGGPVQLRPVTATSYKNNKLSGSMYHRNISFGTKYTDEQIPYNPNNGDLKSVSV